MGISGSFTGLGGELEIGADDTFFSPCYSYCLNIKQRRDTMQPVSVLKWSGRRSRYQGNGVKAISRERGRSSRICILQAYSCFLVVVCIHRGCH